MRHYSRYLAVGRKTYAICASAFFVHRIGLFYAKCFFYHNDIPLNRIFYLVSVYTQVVNMS